MSRRYEPPAEAPSNVTGLVVDAGPAPELALEAELERVMRHQ